MEVLEHQDILPPTYPSLHTSIHYFSLCNLGNCFIFICLHTVLNLHNLKVLTLYFNYLAPLPATLCSICNECVAHTYSFNMNFYTQYFFFIIIFIIIKIMQITILYYYLHCQVRFFISLHDIIGCEVMNKDRCFALSTQDNTCHLTMK